MSAVLEQFGPLGGDSRQSHTASGATALLLVGASPRSWDVTLSKTQSSTPPVWSPHPLAPFAPPHRPKSTTVHPWRPASCTVHRPIWGTLSRYILGSFNVRRGLWPTRGGDWSAIPCSDINLLPPTFVKAVDPVSSFAVPPEPVAPNPLEISAIHSSRHIRQNAFESKVRCQINAGCPTFLVQWRLAPRIVWNNSQVRPMTAQGPASKSYGTASNLTTLPLRVFIELAIKTGQVDLFHASAPLVR